MAWGASLQRGQWSGGVDGACEATGTPEDKSLCTHQHGSCLPPLTTFPSRASVIHHVLSFGYSAELARLNRLLILHRSCAHGLRTFGYITHGYSPAHAQRGTGQRAQTCRDMRQLLRASKPLGNARSEAGARGRWYLHLHTVNVRLQWTTGSAHSRLQTHEAMLNC